MAIAAQLGFDWNLTASGLLTNSKVAACAAFADLPDTDPTFVYQGPGSTYEAMSIVDDVGAVPELPFVVTVDGAPVATGGNHWLKFDLSNPVLEYIRIYFHGGASPAITLKEDMLKFGIIRFNAANATGTLNNLDHSGMYDPFCFMQEQITNAMKRLIPHVQSNNGAPFDIVADKDYFVEELKRSTTGELKYRFRDPLDNWAILGEIETTFSPSAFGTYANFTGCVSDHPNCTGETLWGPFFFVYEPTGFLDFAEVGGVIQAETATFGTVRVG